MTLNALLKKLQKLQDAGHGRLPVTVNKESLWDGNGTFVICDVDTAEVKHVEKVDEDGFLTGRGEWNVILEGK